MNKEYQVQPKSVGAFVKLLSGFFNLTKKECQVLAAIIHLMKESNTNKVDKDIKKQVSAISNFGYQIVTNYINGLKRKKAINSDGSLHPILNSTKITIMYG